VKMKVRVTNLQAAIQNHIKEDEKRFDRETKKYKERLVVAREKYTENLEQYLRDFKAGKERIGRYDLENKLDKGCNWPTEPKEVNRHVSLLVKLDLAEDEILVVDDHSDYMKFIDGKCVCS
jgi:hypothetical protein